MVDLDGVWHVTSFYRFLPILLPRVVALQAEFEQFMTEQGLLGLVIVAPEGINGTIAGGESSVTAFRSFLAIETGLTDVSFKDSVSKVPPFHRRSVVIRDEIVGLKRPDLVPGEPQNHHLTPREWHAFLDSGEPHVMIDTRNIYETEVGKFRGAIDPGLKTFSEWGEYLDRTELPRDVPVLIYCTGGIRCEKAILEMQGRGFREVYQLRDGILGYLAEFPDGHYEGECFVFDDRVAVGADLAPTTRFGICPGCGLTGSLPANCERCGAPYFRCAACEEAADPVCSKACRDLWRRHGASGGRRQVHPD